VLCEHRPGALRGQSRNVRGGKGWRGVQVDVNAANGARQQKNGGGGEHAGGGRHCRRDREGAAVSGQLYSFLFEVRPSSSCHCQWWLSSANAMLSCPVLLLGPRTR
jgi:hypothetical protein